VTGAAEQRQRPRGQQMLAHPPTGYLREADLLPL
jgi:hypothetical protein